MHVHDRGAPPAGTPRAAAPEQGLINAATPPPRRPARCRRPAALVPKRAPPGSRCASHSPTRRHIGDGPGVAAPSHRRPASRPRRQRGPSGRDPVIDLGSRTHRAPRIDTAPAALVPDEAHRAPERRQIRQPHQGRALRPHHPPQPPQAGRARVRMCNTNSPPGASSTPSTSTSPRPTINSQIRVGFSSTGASLESVSPKPDSGGTDPAYRGPTPRPFPKRPIPWQSHKSVDVRGAAPVRRPGSPDGSMRAASGLIERQHQRIDGDASPMWALCRDPWRRGLYRATPLVQSQGSRPALAAAIAMSPALAWRGTPLFKEDRR